MTEEQIQAVEEMKKQLHEIQVKSKKERAEVFLAQDKDGFTEKINGGYTFRIGNEVKDFERAFGIAALQE